MLLKFRKVNPNVEMSYTTFVRNEFANEIVQQFSNINRLLSNTSWSTDMDLTKFISFVSLWYAANAKSMYVATTDFLNGEQIFSTSSMNREFVNYNPDRVCREEFRPWIEAEPVMNNFQYKIQSTIRTGDLTDIALPRFEMDFFTSKFLAHCDFIFDDDKLYIDPATLSNRHMEMNLNIETASEETDWIQTDKIDDSGLNVTELEPDNEVDPLEVLLRQLNTTAKYFIRLGIA